MNQTTKKIVKISDKLTSDLYNKTTLLVSRLDETKVDTHEHRFYG